MRVLEVYSLLFGIVLRPSRKWMVRKSSIPLHTKKAMQTTENSSPHDFNVKK